MSWKSRGPGAASVPAILVWHRTNHPASWIQPPTVTKQHGNNCLDSHTVTPSRFKICCVWMLLQNPVTLHKDRSILSILFFFLFCWEMMCPIEPGYGLLSCWEVAKVCHWSLRHSHKVGAMGQKRGATVELETTKQMYGKDSAWFCLTFTVWKTLL